MSVHSTSLVFEIAPADAAVPKVACSRVELLATFAVPLWPGSPVCNWIQIAAFEYATPPASASEPGVADGFGHGARSIPPPSS